MICVVESSSPLSLYWSKREVRLEVGHVSQKKMVKSTADLSYRQECCEEGEITQMEAMAIKLYMPVECVISP